MNKLAIGTKMFMVELRSDNPVLTVTNAGTVSHSNFPGYFIIHGSRVSEHLVYGWHHQPHVIECPVQLLVHAFLWCEEHNIEAASYIVRETYNMSVNARRTELQKLLAKCTNV